MRVFIPRFLRSLLHLLGLTLVGVTLSEGRGVQDARYMSVITITAVGYSKVLPLSPLGRDCTTLLFGRRRYRHWCVVRAYHLA
jgi:hypothetical protein